ncbi:hypothetical protein D3C81_566700 [compost metagenome]
MENRWHAHPDPSIESLLQSADASILAGALSHPRIENDPYARLRAIDRLHQLLPGHQQTQHMWLQLMLMSNRTEPVWDWLQRALRDGALDGHLLILAAQVAQVSGDREMARTLYLRRIQHQPDDVDAWQKYLESSALHAPRASFAVQLEDMLTRAPDAYAAEKLQFALAACLIPTDPERAFSLAATAQNLKKRRIPSWQPSELQQRLRNDLQLATSTPARASHLTPQMLFIVGMPRSGTTLLSSLLGAHSALCNVGEQNLVPSLARQTITRPNTPTTSALIDFASKWYRAATNDLCPTGTISVDKLPANIEHCGFILACLPAAKIIHIRRHSHDCATSIHLRDFDFGCGYATSAEKIAHYDALTYTHIHQIGQIHPGRVITTNFEDLITAPEPTLSTILLQLNLQWEPQMLEFWKNRQGTATFSEAQVRRPLNADGLGISKRAGKAATAFLLDYDRAYATVLANTQHERPHS